MSDNENEIENDSEENASHDRNDKQIYDHIAVLNEIKRCGTINDIETYKKETDNLFELLILKIEDDGYNMYTMDNRIKYLEEECYNKDLEIERLSNGVQEALDECKMAAEAMAEDMLAKLDREVHYRQQIERHLLRTKKEQQKLQESLKLSRNPIDLDGLIDQIEQKEFTKYQEEIEDLKAQLILKSTECEHLKSKRDAEMKILLHVIKDNQENMERLYLQIKCHHQQQSTGQPANVNKASPKREVFVTENDTMENSLNSSMRSEISITSESSPHSSFMKDKGKSAIIKPKKGKYNKNRKGNYNKSPPPEKNSQSPLLTPPPIDRTQRHSKSFDDKGKESFQSDSALSPNKLNQQLEDDNSSKLSPSTVQISVDESGKMKKEKSSSFWSKHPFKS